FRPGTRELYLGSREEEGRDGRQSSPERLVAVVAGEQVQEIGHIRSHIVAGAALDLRRRPQPLHGAGNPHDLVGELTGSPLDATIQALLAAEIIGGSEDRSAHDVRTQVAQQRAHRILQHQGVPRRAGGGSDDNGHAGDRVRVERVHEHLEQARVAGGEDGACRNHRVGRRDLILGSLELLRGDPGGHHRGQVGGVFADVDVLHGHGLPAAPNLGIHRTGDALGELAGRRWAAQTSVENAEGVHELFCYILSLSFRRRTYSGDTRPARPEPATTAELLHLRGLHLPVRGVRPLRHQRGVGWRIGGHVRRAAAFELLPQDRHDLPTEDLDLLEHQLLRQPGVVDQEELALIVAYRVSVTQVTFDDLLRGADRQRADALELLQRRPVPVDRGVVEERTEGGLGLLLGIGGEDLPAQAHDRLVGRAVPVVFEALAVQAHQLLGVLDVPEDVVMEETVPVVRGLLGDLRGADGTVPHEGRDVVQGTWGGRELLQRGAELPLPRQVLLAPQATQQVVILHGKRDRLADVLTEPRIDGAGIATAEHEVHASLREVLDVGVILRDPHRVGGGNQRGRGGELEGFSLRGEVREQDWWVCG